LFEGERHADEHLDPAIFEIASTKHSRTEGFGSWGLSFLYQRLASTRIGLIFFPKLAPLDLIGCVALIGYLALKFACYGLLGQPLEGLQ
jgi:hypothetical protein